MLLYSGQQLEHTGSHSYLAVYPLETIRSDNFNPLEIKLTKNQPVFANAWFGYLGYELLHDVESVAREKNSYIDLPDLCFVHFGLILCFDHIARRVTCHYHESVSLPDILADAQRIKPEAPEIAAIHSLIDHDAYIAIIEETREAIARGDFYQANITRKFTGEFAHVPDTFNIFLRLLDASPSAYSAFIRTGTVAVISSSPENFLTISNQGEMQTRPIKGTAARHSDKKKDAAARTALEKSAKERAENLMIVDLMRNDFSGSAISGSVNVTQLFATTSYTTLHHLSSTVIAQKKPEISTLQAVKQCFPPGSMTGAPKLSAIKWCMEKENIRRGVYSGALGWFGGDGSCDLSVVIRTLIIADKQFEFQVGGGITMDSDPEKEWQETLIKAKGIMTALGIPV